MKKKYVFIRTSTTEQTPDLQLNDIIKTFGLTDYFIIEEKESAYKENSKRIEFEKLKKQISENNVSDLYVWDLDRLFRNRKKLIEFLQFCNHKKTSLFSFNQQWLQTIQNVQAPFNEIMFDLMIQVMGWLAEEDSKKKSNRVKMALKKTNDNVTVSYKGNRWGRKPLSKQAVNKILELHNNGLTIRQIAKQVNIYDSNNNGRSISIGAVHKTIHSFQVEKVSI
jgi:DNA invertase Pin-like site-specific DNA recombinase